MPDLCDITVSAAQMGGARFEHIGPPPDREGKQERQRPVTFEGRLLCDSTFRDVDLTNVQIIECDVAGIKIDGVLVSDLVAAYKNQQKTANP